MADDANRNSAAVRANVFVLRLTRNWLKIALVAIGLFAAGPWLAPTLMKLGATGPADFLYTIYSPLCHQFAFRSIFLYGEQPFYPREISDSDLKSYEAITQEIPGFYDGWGGRIPNFSVPTATDTLPRSLWEPARAFRGTEQVGYKTAICARDVMIYAGLFLGGLIYAIPYVRRRLRPLPLIWWIIIGIGPIALDGGSQLLSYEPFNLWPVRETEPFFRVMTGLIFGLANAWLGFPYIEMSMYDTRRQIEEKLARIGIFI